MTVLGVKRAVTKIRDLAGYDDESAHAREDELWADVLEAIASGKGDPPADLARAALATREIAFSRWYA
jgi:hypothetical protein